jgi:2-polyprenyl-6-methoxyphenol hydroxylase-like FAD-dependent oxidoreductase
MEGTVTRVGIIGGGVAGLHLGLYLRANGMAATIYATKTPDQHRADRLRNVVCRNGRTRQRQEALGVNHWDGEAPDLRELSVSVAGPRPMSFAGTLAPAAHVVDMRLYWARLLEDFIARGGDVVFGAVQAADVEPLSSQFDLTVVASGRGSLANLFPLMPGYSPYPVPQRLVVAALMRGIAYREPLGFEVVVARGAGEILAFPMCSFEPGLTAIGIEIIRGGPFTPLATLHYDAAPREVETFIAGLFRDHAPAIHERVDPKRFGVARPVDIGHVAITPAARRAFTRLPNGRAVLALGDAHVVMDPLTGQGANKASHAAWVVGDAIREGGPYDEEFCTMVEQRMCAYALPVSDACNARLQPAPPHVQQLFAAAAQRQVIADVYGYGFNHPDEYWRIVSDADRTALLVRLLSQDTPPPVPEAIRAVGSGLESSLFSRSGTD